MERMRKIKFHIGSDGDIQVYPTNKEIATALVKIESAEYDHKNKKWKLSVKDYFKAYEELRKVGTVDKIPRGVIKLAMRGESNIEFALCGTIYSKLLPFQMAGVLFGLRHGGRVMIADDMGLGKTVQALAIAEYYKLEWPVLVISPASLLENWVESVNRFLETDASIVRKKSDFGCSNFEIIGYEMATKYSAEIQGRNYFIVIVDECHYLKNMSSKRCSQLVPIIRKANRIVLLSGTPALSRPLELYPVFQIFDEKLFSNFFEYGKRYCDAKKKLRWYDYKGASNTEELNFILSKLCMIRRMKADVLKDLPKKFRRHIVLSPRTKQSIKINDLSDITRLYKEAAEHKIESVLDYLEGILEKNIKFLVFAHHAQMISAIEEFVRSKDHRYIKIDGSVPVSTRHDLVSEFQTDNSINVAILSLTAASTGLTLTSAKMVVFAELYWNPGILLQAEDRIHRIGQQDCVDIHYLTAKYTFDEYVWPKMVQKLNVLEKIGIGKQELKNVESMNINQELLDKFIVQ